MKIIKVVCHQRYPENAISNLAAVLSAIHKGERVTIAEVRCITVPAGHFTERFHGPARGIPVWL